MHENRPPRPPLRPPLPSFSREKRPNKKVSDHVVGLFVFVFEQGKTLGILIIVCISASGIKAGNPQSASTHEPKIYQTATLPVSKNLSNTSFACMLGVGTEGIISSEQQRVQPTPAGLVNKLNFSNSTTIVSINQTIKETLHEFQKEQYPYIPDQTFFLRTFPNGKKGFVNFLNFGMRQKLNEIYQEFSHKRIKLHLRANEVLIFAFQNKDFCVTTSNLAYLSTEVRAVSQKVENFKKELEMADKKDVIALANLEKSSQAIRQEMDKTFQNILEAHVEIGIAKAKGCSTLNAYYIPVKTEIDSHGRSIRKLEFAKARQSIK